MKTFLTFIFLFTAILINAQWNLQYTLNQGNMYSLEFKDVNTGFSYFETNPTRSIFKTDDGGITWDSVPTAFNGYVMDIHFPNPDTGYAVGGAWFPVPSWQYYAYSIMRTVDGGNSWDSLYVGGQGGGAYYDIAQGSYGLFAVGDIDIILSTDNGQSFSTLNLPNAPTNILYKGVHFTSAQVGYIHGSRYNSSQNFTSFIFKTVDGGSTWNLTDSINNMSSNPEAKSMYWVDDMNGILSLERGKIWLSSDGGNSWTSTILPDSLIRLQMFEQVPNGALYAVNSHIDTNGHRLYYSTNMGQTWTPNPTPVDSTFNGINGFSAPANGVLYFNTYTEVYRGQNVLTLNEYPEKEIYFYPNPSSTFLNFSTKVSTVIIFDENGKLVKQEILPKGTQQLNISQLTPGFYFVQTQEENGRKSYHKFIKI